MNYLFFLVHPSKYNVFRHTINRLKSNGHTVDITITNKDVLEDLVKNEGWEYTNIFKKGRKIKGLPVKLGAIINTFRTVIRLYRYIGKKKYDLFITDDLLSVVGKIKKVPSFVLQDDDITVVPETALLFYFTDYILSPRCSNMGRFEKKKIPFKGFKELGAFHPNKFKPDYSVVEKFNPSGEKYFILRLVSLKAVHDSGKKGLSNDNILSLIKLLHKKGKVFISAERELPQDFEKYRISIRPNDIAHALYFAEFLISDSQTMSAEAAVLGTPFIRYNDFVDRISYLAELERKYELGFGVKTHEIDKLFELVETMLATSDLKVKWKEKRMNMLNENMDLTEFFVWLFEGFPESTGKLKESENYQNMFIGTNKLNG